MPSTACEVVAAPAGDDPHGRVRGGKRAAYLADQAVPAHHDRHLAAADRGARLVDPVLQAGCDHRPELEAPRAHLALDLGQELRPPAGARGGIDYQQQAPIRAHAGNLATSRSRHPRCPRRPPRGRDGESRGAEPSRAYRRGWRSPGGGDDDVAARDAARAISAKKGGMLSCVTRSKDSASQGSFEASPTRNATRPSGSSPTRRELGGSSPRRGPPRARGRGGTPGPAAMRRTQSRCRRREPLRLGTDVEQRRGQRGQVLEPRRGPACPIRVPSPRRCSDRAPEQQPSDRGVGDDRVHRAPEQLYVARGERIGWARGHGSDDPSRCGRPSAGGLDHLAFPPLFRRAPQSLALALAAALLLAACGDDDDEQADAGPRPASRWASPAPSRESSGSPASGFRVPARPSSRRIAAISRSSSTPSAPRRRLRRSRGWSSRGSMTKP